MGSPPVIPDHTLLRPIGRGAYGEVWLARNVMGAPRAVKIIWRHQFDSDRPYEREFAGIQRYEPVSRMTDGLVQVLHIGRNEAEGYFYYVMELGDPGNDEFRIANTELGSKPTLGTHSTLDTRHLQLYAPRTLRSDLKRLGHLPVAGCLQIGLDVVSGLARLHQQGLVHRDVKPGNIIFVNGRAKLADIGLVSLGGEARTFVGTEGYIPPEGPGTPAADIYALGMVLYEAVTGYPPDSFPKVPAEWFADEPQNFNLNANPNLNEIEFHEIVLKACEGDKERRYQTPGQMQADLALLQSGQSVRRTRALEKRVARFRVFGLAAVLMLLLATGAVLLANYRARIEARNRAKELVLRQRAEAAEHEGRNQLYTALAREAHATVESRELGQRTRALEAIRQAAAISNSTELRREAMAALSRPDLRFRYELSIGTEVSIVSCDPSFQRVALCQGTNHLEIHSLNAANPDPGPDTLLLTLPASTNLPAYGCDWSADGKWLAVRRDHPPNAAYATIEVWYVPSFNSNRNHSSRSAPALLRHEVPHGAVSFHPGSHQVLIGYRDQTAGVYSLKDFQEIGRVALEPGLERLKYSPDGQLVAAIFATNAASSNVEVYHVSNGKRLATHRFDEAIGTIDWHANGRWISVPNGSGGVYLIDISQSRSSNTASAPGPVRLLGHHKAQAATTIFTPDGNYLFSGGWERELICWDIRTMERSFTIPLGSFVLQFAADGKECAVMSHRSNVQLHSFERPIHREFPEDLGARLRRAAFSPDGRWLGASADKHCAIWDLANSGPGALLAESEAQLNFTPDARELFLSHSSSDAECLRWRLRPATNPGRPPLLEPLPLITPSGLTCLTLASNSVVLTASEGSQLIPLKALGPQPSTQPWAPTSPGVNGASPDGRLLAIYRPFSTSIYLYSLPGFERLAKLRHLAPVAGFQFHPTADALALYSSRGLELWSTKTWACTQTLTNFTAIRFSPDGQGWWLTRDFRTAGLYCPKTLQPRLLLPPGTAPLAISPDGESLAVAVDARRLQLWNIAELRKNFRDLGIDWAD